MIKIEDYKVWGFTKAIEGIRNSYNSRSKGDSCTSTLEDGSIEFQMGEKDLKLVKNLIAEGEPCRKFLRMVHVQCDVTAPLYWWKQFDAYKIGTTSNSASTMHTLADRPLKVSDFSCEEGFEDILQKIIDEINTLYTGYCIDKDKRLWNAIIQLLPEGYNQLRTIDLNYEVLLQMHKWRKYHKLKEWHDFCLWIEDLPYMRDFLWWVK